MAEIRVQMTKEYRISGPSDTIWLVSVFVKMNCSPFSAVCSVRALASRYVLNCSSYLPTFNIYSSVYCWPKACGFSFSTQHHQINQQIRILSVFCVCFFENQNHRLLDFFLRTSGLTPFFFSCYSNAVARCVNNKRLHTYIVTVSIHAWCRQ